MYRITQFKFQNGLTPYWWYDKRIGIQKKMGGRY